jgi:Methyltransferase domain
MSSVPETVRKSVSSRPWIKLDYIVRNEKEANGIYNDYIKSFCGDEEFVKRLFDLVESDSAFLKLLNKQDLKKELTECYSAICLAERALRRRRHSTSLKIDLNGTQYCVPCDTIQRNPISSIDPDSLENGMTHNFGHEEPLLTFSAIRENGKNLTFYDVCSGKGILSFLLAILFPEIPRIAMVDSNADMKLDHLTSECCSSVTFEKQDIHSGEFADFLVSESEICRLSNRIPIIIGLHLCGTLSTRLTQLYNSIVGLPVLIVSPCCAPTRSKKNRAFMTRERLRQNKWSSYAFWYMTVYVSICPLLSVKDIVKDELVLSEKNTLILAMKRTFLPS